MYEFTPRIYKRGFNAERISIRGDMITPTEPNPR